jgi:serine/threonine protein kinase
MMSQLLKGLVHLQNNNIVHRDIKPQNILLKNKDSLELVIADMGLATVVDAEEYLFTRCGTPGYVAPEIMEALPDEKLFNTSSDIFSLGAVFHLLLTGEQLFEGNSPAEMLERNKKMEFELGGERYDFINEKAMTLLRRMLVRDPYQRIRADEALRDAYFGEEEPIKVSSPILTYATRNSNIQLPFVE